MTHIAIPDELAGLAPFLFFALIVALDLIVIFAGPVAEQMQ